MFYNLLIPNTFTKQKPLWYSMGNRSGNPTLITMKNTLATISIATALLTTAAFALVPELRNHPTPTQVLEMSTTRVIYPDLRSLPVPPSTLNQSHVIIHHSSR